MRYKTEEIGRGRGTGSETGSGVIWSLPRPAQPTPIAGPPMPRPFTKAERLQKLPPYLFAEIDRKKKAAIAAGRDVINLGVGDPDRPTPRPIIESLQKK